MRVITVLNLHLVKHIGSIKDRLIIANEGAVSVVKLSVEFEMLKDGETVNASWSDNKPYQMDFDPPVRLHALVENGFCGDDYILLALELADNQLAFERLYMWDKDETFKLELFPYREIFLRQAPHDPISRIKIILKQNEYLFAMALRTSGCVDLYFNYSLVSESTSKT